MKKSWFYYLVGSTWLLSACGGGGGSTPGGEEPDLPVVESTVSFDASINPASRASDTQFDVDDEISVFGVLSTGDDNKGIISSTGNYADNVRYYYDGSKFVSTHGIDRPTDGDKVYYHAVYPYCADAAGSFTFKVQGDQLTNNGYTRSDLCTASTNATDAALVPLKFNHRLTKLIVDLQGDNWPTGEMELSLNSVYTEVQVDLNNLTFTPTGSKTGITCASNGTKSFKVIIPPQRVSASESFATLTIGGTPYDISLEGGADLSSGVQLELTLTMNEDREIVEFTGDINPWEDAEEPDEPGGDDTENPWKGIVPDDIFAKLKAHMPIYVGQDPPVVEGSYVISPAYFVYCEDDPDDVGMSLVDHYFRFQNQNTTDNTVDFMEVDADGFGAGSGSGALIGGTGSNFTVLFTTQGEGEGISYTSAAVMSGTKVNGGIRDLCYAALLLEKGYDPEGLVMPVGMIRITADRDGLCENYNW